MGRRDVGAWLQVVALLGLSVALVGSLPVAAQEREEPSPIVMFVLDLSGSMNEGSPTKLDQAKEALRQTVAALPDGLPVGLRVYGDLLPSRPPADRQENCETDTRLVLPVEPLDRDRFLAEVDSFTARGDTLIGEALLRAAEDIPAQSSATIVLISDGRDECHDADLDGDPEVGPSWGPAPCEVAAKLKSAGVELSLDRIETVGFHTDAAANAELGCIAEATGGSFIPAENAAELAEKLIAITARAFRSPERLDGIPIEGTPSIQDAPPVTAGEPSQGRYVDTIRAGERRHYRAEMVRDAKGNFTVTVFDLPVQEGTTLSLHWLDAEGERFLRPVQKKDVGMDGARSDSVRYPGIHWYGRGDVGETETYYFAVELESDEPLEGEYDLELFLEGLAFDGAPLGCPEGSVCAYEELIPALEGQHADLEEELAECCAEVPSADADEVTELAAERDRLAEEVSELETELTAAATGATPGGDRMPVLVLALLAVAGGAALFASRRFRPSTQTRRGQPHGDAQP